MAALRFDFPDFAGHPGPFGFREPVRVLRAGSAAEVRGVLRQVEAEARGGRWAAGYVAYEAAPAFDPAMRVRPGATLPPAWFGIYDAPAAVEPDAAAPAGGADVAWQSDTPRAAYDAAIARIRAGIAAGDWYQVNYTMRLRAAARLDLRALADGLRGVHGAGYAAWLDTGTHRVASFSPELFFARRGDSLLTRPMKGTAPRALWLEEDEAVAARLAASDKERAENLMIVDLMRNDLGRIARFGSVHVPRLFEIERYPTVHQMTSTVAAELRAGCTLESIFAALFPSGSVTGAPKLAAMAAIAELERAPRGVYCGAIGMVAPGGDAVFSVAIRTAVAGTAGVEYGVGGGVTWDSTPGGEYDEALAKAAVLAERHPGFELLETMRLDGDGIARLAGHLARLRSSASYFGFPFDEARVRGALDRAAAAAPRPARLRLRLAADGEPAVEAAPLEPAPAIVEAALARTPVRRGDRFLHHKTTHREVYERRLREAGAAEVLLHNEEGELTEFATGNLILELDGALWTPPRRCGLLAGVMRRDLLEGGRIRERILYHRDLGRASGLWLTNSVRGCVPVVLRAGKDGQPATAAPGRGKGIGP